MSVHHITVDDTGDWMYSILRSEAFSKLPPASFRKIFMRMELVSVKAEDTILKQGERGDYYYIIECGRCVVSRIPVRGKTPIKLAELGPGEGFGEEALIAGAPRNATVEMLTDGQLVRLKEPDFRELIKEPLLQAVDCAEASSIVAQGAKWLDIRSPEIFAKYAIAGSINIELCTLRIQLSKLSNDHRYIVCSDSSIESALAAFILMAKGFSACYLSVDVKEYLLHSARQSVELEQVLARGDTIRLDSLITLARDSKPDTPPLPDPKEQQTAADDDSVIPDMIATQDLAQLLEKQTAADDNSVIPDMISTQDLAQLLEKRVHAEISSQLEREMQEFKKELEDRFEEYKEMMLKQLQKRALKIEIAYRKHHLERINALRDQYERSRHAK